MSKKAFAFIILAGMILGLPFLILTLQGCRDAQAQSKEYGAGYERLARSETKSGLSTVLGNGNTSGGTDIALSSGDSLTCTDTSTGETKLTIDMTPSAAWSSDEMVLFDCGGTHCNGTVVKIVSDDANATLLDVNDGSASVLSVTQPGDIAIGATAALSQSATGAAGIDARTHTPGSAFTGDSVSYTCVGTNHNGTCFAVSQDDVGGNIATFSDGSADVLAISQPGVLTLGAGASITQTSTATTGSEAAWTINPGSARTSTGISVASTSTDWGANSALMTLSCGTDTTLGGLALDRTGPGRLAYIYEASDLKETIRTLDNEGGIRIAREVDRPSGDGIVFDSAGAGYGEFTGTTEQAGISIQNDWNQSGAGGAIDLEIDRQGNTVGSGDDDLIQASVAGVEKFAVSSAGAVECASTLTADSTIVSNNALTLTATTTWGSIKESANDGMMIAVANNGGNANHNLIITSSDNRVKDHDHDTLSATPTRIIHSVENPDNSNAEYEKLAHDGSDIVRTCGYGGYSWGVDDQPARGTLTVTGDVTLNETFVLNATTFTAKAAEAAGSDEFLRTGTVTEIADSIVNVINGGSESANAHAYNTAGVVTIEWLTKGVAGNSIVFTEALTNVAIDGSGTLGGTHTAVDAATLMTLEEDGDLTVTGQIKNGTADENGNTVANQANQACTTTCGSATCWAGIDTGTGNFVTCSDNTADSCLCLP